MGPDYPVYGKVVKSLVVQLLGGSCCLDVVGGQPYLVAQFEAWGRGARGVGMLFLLILHVAHFGTGEVVKVVHGLGEKLLGLGG